MTAYAPAPDNYLRWQQRRGIGPDDALIADAMIAACASPAPAFQVIMRVDSAEHPGIARTVQGLRQQLLQGWRLDVFCRNRLEGSAGAGSDPALRWHLVGHGHEMRAAIDAVVAACDADWIIELPPGAIPSQLCLLHIASHAHPTCQQDAPQPSAIYVDDDLVGADGSRAAPRFKPGFDPDWMRSCDLAGPLFVTSQAWRAAGGASPCDEKPWFDMLLRLIEAGLGPSIDHIDEPLLSLPADADTEHAAQRCRDALSQHLQRAGERADIVPVAPSAWRIQRTRPAAAPEVTIAIPSRDRPELLAACIESISQHTGYPSYEVLVVDGQSVEHDTHQLHASLSAAGKPRVRIVTHTGGWSYAGFANCAASNATGQLLLLLTDDMRITADGWLDALVANVLRQDIAAVAPRVALAADGCIESAGHVPGVGGVRGTPHALQASPADGGYLDCLQVDRRVPALPGACLLVERSSFIACGGMDAARFAADFADIDFCIRLRQSTGRACLVCAGVTVTRTSGGSLAPFADAPVARAQRLAAQTLAEDSLYARWFAHFFAARFWSRHLGCMNDAAQLTTTFAPPWAALPAPLPRFAVFPELGAQGHYRVARPLAAARRGGKALACDYDTSRSDEAVVPTHALARFRPDVVIAHLATHERSIAMLAELRRFMPETFLVFACDDLVTDIPAHIAARRDLPQDMRTRLSRALASCHRLVVSTPYLAEACRHYIDDIRVVPNRLERRVWAPLRSQRQTGRRPRVGWAGGVTHEADLLLVEQVVEATAAEFEWVFFGMCPRRLRRHVREYHPPVDIESYPAYLAGLNLDIAIAPLEDIPFNRARSNLRLLEYGALAIPVVCSDIAPYRDSPACKVSSDPRAWMDALRARASDPEAAAHEGQSLKAWVERGYLLEDHIDAWLQAHLPG